MSDTHGTVVENLFHKFFTPCGDLEVLGGLSFRVGTGEVLSILGPSGCGKSTLLRCIGGLLRFTSGEVRVAGMPPAQALASKSIGFAFQDPALLPWRSVESNILLPVELGPQRDRETDCRPKLESLLSLTGLVSFRRFLPAQLSGGMKQRASLARALLLQPSLLLLDEPFGSLDLLTRTRLSAELSRLVFETRVPTVIVSHSIEEAVFLGTRVLVLSPLPARIMDEVQVDLCMPRDLSLLEEPVFLQTVAHFRSLLLNTESDS